jgi:hypothetical protein
MLACCQPTGTVALAPWCSLPFPRFSYLAVYQEIPARLPALQELAQGLRFL